MRDDLLKVLDIPEGRRFLWKILSEAGTFRVGLIDKDTMLYEEGKRFMGIKLYNEIMEAKPEKFIQMQKEFKADAILDKRLSEDLKAEGSEEYL